MTPEQHQLIVDNRHLVHAALKALGGMGRYADRDGLIGAGNLALVQAAARWDPTRGVPFRAFAFIRVRGALIDEARAGGFGPRRVHDEAVLVHRATATLQQSLGHQPSGQELAEHLGWPLEQVLGSHAEASATYLWSLDLIMLESGLGVLGVEPADPAPGPEARYDAAETAREVHAAIAQLRPRHRAILTAYYLHGRDQDDIAAEYGVTDSRISQILTAARARLKQSLTDQRHTRAA